MSSLERKGLEAILAHSRKALLAGDLAELAGLSGQLETAVLTEKPKSLAEAQRIKQMAEENGLLFAAAMKGVRAARQRLRDLSDHGRFSTYESSGKRRQTGSDNQAPARRL